MGVWLAKQGDCDTKRDDLVQEFVAYKHGDLVKKQVHKSRMGGSCWEDV